MANGGRFQGSVNLRHYVTRVISSSSKRNVYFIIRKCKNAPISPALPFLSLCVIMKNWRRSKVSLVMDRELADIVPSKSAFVLRQESAEDFSTSSRKRFMQWT